MLHAYIVKAHYAFVHAIYLSTGVIPHDQEWKIDLVLPVHKSFDPSSVKTTDLPPCYVIPQKF